MSTVSFDDILKAFEQAEMRIVGRKDEGKAIMFLWMPMPCEDECDRCKHVETIVSQWLVREDWFHIVPNHAFALLRGHIQRINKESDSVFVRFEVVRIRADEEQWDAFRKVVGSIDITVKEDASIFVPVMGDTKHLHKGALN